MNWIDLYQEAAEKHGVATHRCAEMAGVPRNTFVDRARREAWPEPFPGAFVLPGWPVSGLRMFCFCPQGQYPMYFRLPRSRVRY
jgi:hypothetical protein